MWLAITAKLASSSCDVEGDPSTALRYTALGEAVVTFPRPYDAFAERRARAHLEQVGRLCDDVSGRLWFAQLVVRGGQASQEEEELSAVGRGEGRAFCAPPACAPFQLVGTVLFYISCYLYFYSAKSGGLVLGFFSRSLFFLPKNIPFGGDQPFG